MLKTHRSIDASWMCQFKRSQVGTEGVSDEYSARIDDKVREEVLLDFLEGSCDRFEEGGIMLEKLERHSSNHLLE